MVKKVATQIDGRALLYGLLNIFPIGFVSIKANIIYTNIIGANITPNKKAHGPRSKWKGIQPQKK